MNLVLEPAFALMYYMGFTYTEVMNLPITYRRWFLERVQKELNRTGPNGENPPSRAADQNTPQMRQLMGNQRDAVPAKLRRFT